MTTCGRCLVEIEYDYTLHTWYNPASHSQEGIVQCGYRIVHNDRRDHHPDAEPDPTTLLQKHKEIHG